MRCMAQVPALLTAPEVADQARVSPETVRRWVREGLLPAIELPSGRLRFRPEDIEALLTKAAS